MAQPPAPQWLNNGSTQAFQSLYQSSQVLDPKFNRELAFKRAMKVFYVSYPEITDGCPQFQQRKCSDFTGQMSQLYRIPAQQINKLMNNAFEEAQQEGHRITLFVKEVKGIDYITNPRLMVGFDGKSRSQIQLDALPLNLVSISVSNYKFRLCRQQNCGFELSIRGDNLIKLHLYLSSPSFNIMDIHPEGYEDWLDFGCGVRLLICVEDTVPRENNAVREEVSSFHMQTISLMLARRLFIFNQSLYRNTGHKEIAMKYKISYRRPLSNPQSDDMFWSVPNQMTVPRRCVLKFNDMQTLFESSDELEDRVCLCSEWCNWNAFFFHNPIYRFLMVRHNQLFVRNNSNVPDMYLCLSIIYGCLTQQFPKLPVLQLMNSANEYRRRYNDNYIVKYNQYRIRYQSSYPDPPTINAVAYNRLRNYMNVQTLCHTLDANPFSDNCIENWLHYYKVLSDLHVLHSMNTAFVPIPNTHLWFRDLEIITRHKYQAFVKFGYDTCMANDLGDFDYIFTKDYEYAHILVKTDDEKYIKKMRDNIVKVPWTDNDNPFNFKVHMNDFLSTIASIYKFLSKVEVMLPKARRTDAIKEVYNCFLEMDTDFNDYILNQNKTFVFKIRKIGANYKHLKQNLYVFYTLKVFFYAFEIQKHSINYGLKHSECQSYSAQICQLFKFIWKNEPIYDTYWNRYQPNSVFPIIDDFDHPLTEFYTNFYGTPLHESVSIHNIGSIDDIIHSGHTQHRKLYVWWRNDGNSRRKFTNIVESLTLIVIEISEHSHNVYHTWIIPALNDLPEAHPCSIEVFDHLIYYLVKANCSLILDTIAMYFKRMHALQVSALTSRGISYSLSKPGWVSLFRAMSTFMDTLDNLEENFLIFDDEFERISNTCIETKKIVKQLFQQFYNKLSFEWIDEIQSVIGFINNGQIIANNTVREFIFMHLVVGLSFISAFGDEFRYHFSYFRKSIRTIFRVNPIPQLLDPLQYDGIGYILREYFREDKAFLRNAMPYQSYFWTGNQYLVDLKNQLDQLTVQDFNIDLVEADSVL